LNPSSPHDDSHALNPASPSDSRPLRLDPSLAYDLDSNSVPQSSSQKFKSLSEIMSTTTPLTPAPDSSPQIASSPDESHSSSSESWAPTDAHSGSTNSWSPQHHVSPPAGSPGEDYVPSPQNLGDDLPSDSHPGSTSEEYYSSSSSSDQSSGEEYHPSSPDHLPTEESYSSPSDQSSGEEYHPASTSNPGPSTEPNPPPRAKRPRPEGELDSASSLSKIFKGKFKRRLSGSGARMRHRRTCGVPLTLGRE